MIQKFVASWVNRKMKKNSGQILILVLLIVVVFVGVTVTITTLTTRELEMREMEESALKTQYAAESGGERALHYIKIHNPTTKITINEDTSTTDKNPLDNGYIYTVTITPHGIEGCNVGAGNYCIKSIGEKP